MEKRQSCGLKLNLLTEGPAQVYLINRPFDMGLGGAFQKTRGLNHLQPKMVLSEKHCFFTCPLQRFLTYDTFTILHFSWGVNKQK